MGAECEATQDTQGFQIAGFPGIGISRGRGQRPFAIDPLPRVTPKEDEKAALSPAFGAGCRPCYMLLSLTSAGQPAPMPPNADLDLIRSSRDRFWRIASRPCWTMSVNASLWARDELDASCAENCTLSFKACLGIILALVTFGSVLSESACRGLRRQCQLRVRRPEDRDP